MSSTNTRVAGVLSLLSLVGLAGGALAQGAKGSGEFEKPLTARWAAGPQGGGSSTTMIKSVEGDDTYEVSIVDGKVTAKINGKKVPEDRVRRRDDKIELLDKDGEVVHTFNVSIAGARQGGPVFWQGKEFRQLSPEQFQFFAPGAAGSEGVEPPPVMLGVTMNDAGDEAREEAGLEEGGIVIERVIDGLPADEAGVKAGDLVIAVNGKPATAQQLRDILRDKKPGDTITLRVKREDSEKNVKIELQKYDAQRLGNTINITPMEGGQEWGVAAQEMHERMTEAYREAMKNAPNRFQGRVLGVQPDQMQWFTVPGRPGGDRVGELSERLDKLDERLNKLDERLARLAETLEKLGNNR